MRTLRNCCAALLAALAGAAVAADPPFTGRQVYEQRCRTCHGTTAPADIQLGPDLAGILGATAGTKASGLHSRDAIDSGIVWDRDSLRGFLSVPRQVIPGSIMPDGVRDPVELELLLDFLETL